MSPPPSDQVRWINHHDSEFQDLIRGSQQFQVVFDNIRETGNIFCWEASNDTIQQLTQKLQPLAVSLAQDPTELDAIRHGQWPNLAVLWLRGLRRISGFLSVLYHVPTIENLRNKYNGRVPDIFKHDLDSPTFCWYMRETKKVFSNPHFRRVLAEVCKLWGLAYDGFPFSPVFLERVILDISALENDLPPPSFVASPEYHMRLQSRFPPPIWAARDFYMSYNVLQDGELPGVFPEQLTHPPQHNPFSTRYLSDHAEDGEGAHWTQMEQRAEDQLRDLAAARLDASSSPHVSTNPRTGRGLFLERRDLQCCSRAGRTPRSICKAARLRAQFGPKPQSTRRVSPPDQGSPQRQAIERGSNEDPELRSHLNPGSLRSALRRRIPKSPNWSSPRSGREEPRRRKSVRFADGVISPQPRSHGGLGIPRADDPSAVDDLPGSSSPELPPFPDTQSPTPSSAPASSKSTPHSHVGMESSQPRILDDEDVTQLREELEGMEFVENEFGTSRRRYHPMPPAEQLTEEERRQRLMDLFSLPSPPGLRQSDDSKIAIELRKQKEAAEAAEARRKTEEKARKEAEARARRELEERLAKSGGLRLPQKHFVTPLSADWTHRAQNTLRAGPSTNLATTGEGVDLRRHDFTKVVQETEWLNDEIVNGSLNWLDRAINSAAGIKNVKIQTRKCLALSSFFFKRLKDQGVTGTVRTLSRNGVKKENLLDVDTILLPICENSHWTLLVIRPSKRTVAHMDSLNPRGSSANTNLGLAWMKEVLQEKFFESEWKVIRHEAPRQMNGWDCGVHTITNAMCVSLGLSPIDCYSAEDMPLQRLRIACVLLNGGFMGEFDLQVY